MNGRCHYSLIKSLMMKPWIINGVGGKVSNRCERFVESSFAH